MSLHSIKREILYPDIPNTWKEAVVRFNAYWRDSPRIKIIFIRDYPEDLYYTDSGNTIFAFTPFILGWARETYNTEHRKEFNWNDVLVFNTMEQFEKEYKHD